MTGSVTLHPGDCLEVMDAMDADSFDAVATDPPYHLLSIVKRFGGANAAAAKHRTDGNFARSSKGFMGKEWDGGDIAFRPETWAKVLRVMKPGAHLVAFNHSRTWHRMACAIEDAGFEIRDSIFDLHHTGAAWDGFLDSLSPDQAKALSRALAAADGGVLAWIYACGFPKSHVIAKALEKARADHLDIKAAQGWGTALKPAIEPIVLARKPLVESSIARQVQSTATGALNIDAARVPAADRRDLATKFLSNHGSGPRKNAIFGQDARPRDGEAHPLGRWPTNITHDGHPLTLARFPVDGNQTAGRFFFSAKAGKADRRGSKHPTVKPHELMRWLVRLITPKGGKILDPFGGSGATGWAAFAEGAHCHLIEREFEYQADIQRGIADLDRYERPPPPDPDSDQPTLF